MVKRKCQLGLARGDMLGWQAGKMGVEGFGMGVGFVYGVREGGRMCRYLYGVQYNTYVLVRVHSAYEHLL